MYGHVTFEFVLPVEGSMAGLTLVRCFSRVDQHVRLQVVLCLEPLLTCWALKLTYQTRQKEHRRKALELLLTCPHSN